MKTPDSQTLSLFQTLVEIVAKLRGPEGCPWDKEQTAGSLTQYAIEEAHELAEAIDSGRSTDICEELGDFLFQVILQAQVARDQGQFGIDDVLLKLNEKMIRRHPHVFAESQNLPLEEIWRNWEKIKASEKATTQNADPAPALGTARSKVFSAPQKLPALLAASKIGRKTEGWKFDWSKPEEVLAKVHEEYLETQEALTDFRSSHSGLVNPLTPGREELEHEIGDLLFSTAQLARHLSLDPETCLRKTNSRFVRRFERVVELSGLDKDQFAALADSEKETFWNRVKEEEL